MVWVLPSPVWRQWHLWYAVALKHWWPGRWWLDAGKNHQLIWIIYQYSHYLRAFILFLILRWFVFARFLKHQLPITSLLKGSLSKQLFFQRTKTRKMTRLLMVDDEGRDLSTQSTCHWLTWPEACAIPAASAISAAGPPGTIHLTVLH